MELFIYGGFCVVFLLVALVADHWGAREVGRNALLLRVCKVLAFTVGVLASIEFLGAL